MIVFVYRSIYSKNQIELIFVRAFYAFGLVGRKVGSDSLSP